MPACPEHRRVLHVGFWVLFPSKRRQGTLCSHLAPHNKFIVILRSACPTSAKRVGGRDEGPQPMGLAFPVSIEAMRCPSREGTALEFLRRVAQSRRLQRSLGRSHRQNRHVGHPGLPVCHPERSEGPAFLFLPSVLSEPLRQSRVRLQSPVRCGKLPPSRTLQK
jgi:hypothetical protein